MCRALLLSLGLVLAVLLVFGPARPPLPAAAQTQQVWNVQVGGDVPDEGLSARSFFPDTLAIHAGDTITWTFASTEPHNVTYEAGTPQPYMTPGPGPGERTYGPSWFPEGVASGSQYDGTTLVSSGASFAGPDTPPFQLIFTAPGQYKFRCALHWNMENNITVLAPGAALPETPDQATARGQALWQLRLRQVRNNFANNNVNSSPGVFASDIAGPTSSGTIHTVRVGTALPIGFSVLRYVPGDLTVNRGDTVVWSSADNEGLHTVTFTSGAPAAGTLDIRPQPSGPPLYVLPALTASPAGGSDYTGSEYINSGVLQWSGASFALTFDAPAGTYSYQCLIHADMNGTVTVVDEGQ